jgi:hypothetical protein
MIDIKIKNRYLFHISGFTLVLFVILGLWLAPPTISMFYQIWGGQVMKQMLVEERLGDVDTFSCDIEPLSDKKSLMKLDSIIMYMQKAIKYNPKASQPHLLLGRSYCLRGKPIKAVEHYQVFSTLRPENLLGLMELGVTYDVLSTLQNTGGILYEYNDGLQQEIWRATGISTQDLLNRGLDGLKTRSYNEVSLWHRRAWVMNGKLSDEINTDLCERCVVLDSFLTEEWWIPCPWCDNVGGDFSIIEGVMEIGYLNRIEERDAYAFISRPRIPIQDFDQLVIRLKGLPGTLLTLEMVIDGERSRPISYDPVLDYWHMLRVPIQGNRLGEIFISIGEPGKLLDIDYYYLWIDWIALKQNNKN